MRILVTGSRGMIGSALVRHLGESGDQVVRLVRDPAQNEADSIPWDPASGELAHSRVEEFDAVVHLAGHNLAAGRWTKARKAAIRDSRVRSTQLLCEALRRLDHPPEVLASASAIGIYGDRASEVLTEETSLGTGFLAEVCRQWEAATRPAAEVGIRVVHLRFAIVLTADGGALARMLLPFRMGLGGVVGNGQQYWSWIALEDALAAIRFVLVTGGVSGAANLAAPEPVTNREFTRTLGATLGRPTFFSIPAFVARTVFGEMADETLLASTRTMPAKLQANGFRFRHSRLAGTLRSLLQNQAGSPTRFVPEHHRKEPP